MPEATIPTYFSHSYRPGDRELNRLFLRYFWQRDFAFSVDPQTDSLSTMQLSAMMRDSACFVAVVTRRPEKARYLCSPYVVYEYQLAVQAGKPRLVIAERGIAERYFPESRFTVHFNRDRLLNEGDPGSAIEGLAAQVERLARLSRPHAAIGDRPLGRVGLVLPRTGPYVRAVPRIEELVAVAGYTPQRLDVRKLGVYEAATLFDGLDFIVHDPTVQAPGWVLPFVYGRSVPALWLCHRPADTGRPAVHPLLHSEVLHDAGEDDPVVYWSDLDELEEALTRLPVPRRQFTSLEEGERYFASLGRSASDAVFLSTAGEDREVAHQISVALDLKNIRLFHYKFRNEQLPLGEPWEAKLDGLIRGSRLFIPVISRHYRDSEYCRRELQIARDAERKGQLTIIPYYLDDADDLTFPAQGGSLSSAEPLAAQAARLAQNIDTLLLTPPAAAPAAAAARQSRPAPVDIALLTVLPEEYEAMYAQLEEPRRYTGTKSRPNRCDWVVGRIPNATHGDFRVVLGMVKKGTVGTAVNTELTIGLFRPQHVLLVGVAGAIDRKLGKGDVVVAEHVYGYEYGAVGAAGFEPRPDWTWPTDAALATVGRNTDRMYPQWRDLIRRHPPDGDGRPPKVVVGAIASGNKVVDDLDAAAFAPVLAKWPALVAVEMEAAGACEAVQEAVLRNQLVRFTCVRGISDQPLSGRRPKAASRAGQTAQRDTWKEYASDTAAAYARFLIGSLWPQPPRR